VQIGKASSGLKQAVVIAFAFSAGSEDSGESER
jgi:hypothetical protein